MQRKCEDIIDDKLRELIADLLPNIDDWTEDQCREYLADREVDIEDGADIDDLRERCREEHREAEREGVLSVDRISTHRICLSWRGLSVNRLTTYRICLSWGGPAEYLELVRGGKGWLRGQYVYQDGLDSATRPIDATTAAELADLYGIGPDYE